MKKHLIICCVIGFVTACSSFKPDYIIRDASLTSRPSWFVEPKEAANDSKEAEEFSFYKGETENVHKRLCETGAKVRAAENLATEVAQMIVGEYTEQNKAKEDEVSTKIKEDLTRKINVELHNVSLAKLYWEKRAYLVELGAETDIIRYNCVAVVKVPTKIIKTLVESYKDSKKHEITEKTQDN